MEGPALRDPLSPLALVEARLGEVLARRRLDSERAHEAKASGRGFTFLGMESMSIKQIIIEFILRASGTYRRGQANAGKVQPRQNEVPVRLLPEAFDGFTILHLSDLHADMSVSAMERTAELALDLKYDLCVLTGDYRGRTYGDHKPCIEVVARLRGVLRAETYAVLGNHDSLAMVPGLEALGIRVLLNESVAIERGADTIYLAGVDDAHFYHSHDIEKAAADIPEGSTRVLLSHTPEIYAEAARAGFDLMLSGHTHGGQICLPGGIPIVLEADLPRAYAAGAWRHVGMAGYTSVGAGSCLVPVRFNNRPEITLHRLVRRESQGDPSSG
jgi:predicted MPP superfamily phosphohydrolase